MSKITAFRPFRRSRGPWARRRSRNPARIATVLGAIGLVAGCAGLFLLAPDGLLTPNGADGRRDPIADVIAYMPALPAAFSFPRCAIMPVGNCVVDGDTFHYDGMKIRIADIDTPETNPPRCAYEADLGSRATSRLQELLAAGPIDLRRIDRDEDTYGRKLRIVMRDGESIGRILVAEGLARTWTGRRQPWC